MQILEFVSPLEARFEPKISLSPSQQKAADGALLGLERGEFTIVEDHGSAGKTTVLEHIQHEAGGVRIGMRDFLSSLCSREPLAVDEAFLDVIECKLAQTDLLIVDDLHLVKNITSSCYYPREEMFDAVLSSILAQAQASRKRMLFATSVIPGPLASRAHKWTIGDFTVEDFRAITSAYVDPAQARRLDFDEIHRFAPSLNAHQLRKAALWISREPGADTPRLLEYFSEHNLASNVEIEEVEPVTWNDLKGVDDVIRELEAKIALPFENRKLAAELDLKPKRGVLLSGPPGTGKTTIGRALAHRLKGKFFLVDGTVIAGSHHFYREFDRIFDAAKRNAPSVVFIDDADVMFKNDNDGLFRYLLTKLDGLESASSARVCVMMTAMEPSDLPPALLRSGRVELWVETRLPDDEARSQIIRDRLASLPPPLCDIDVAALTKASRGFTGADLKTAIEDGKLLFAHDHAVLPAVEYFLEAIRGVLLNRKKYRQRRPTTAEPLGFRLPGL